MDSDELDIDAEGIDDAALRSRVIRERQRVAAARAAERDELAETLNALQGEAASITADRDRWQERALSAEAENRALLATRVFRWSARARSLWSRIR
ncbi:hypothetical protein IMCC26256_11616 [Actinobacteria bacterium IMCC26256]|nr:hypothetical protein IMCC26256_11616 [Actinobacteria bacterium IMCC26256]